MSKPSSKTAGEILHDMRDGSRARTARYREACKAQGMVVKQIIAPDYQTAEIVAVLARVLRKRSAEDLVACFDKLFEWVNDHPPRQK